MSFGPGLFKVQNLEPGTPLDLGKAAQIFFTVKNDGETDFPYSLSVLSPQQGGILSWEAGYEEIPDPAWCKLEKEEGLAPSKSAAKVGMVITIPKKEEYYNRRWVVAVQLNGGKSKGMGAGLAISARIMLETLPKEVDQEAHQAILPIAPSLVSLDVKAGHPFKVEVLLGNRSGKSVQFTWERLNEVYPDTTKHARYFSDGFLQIQPDSWLSKSETLQMENGGFQKISIQGTVPEKAKAGQKWEEIVFFRACPVQGEEKGGKETPVNGKEKTGENGKAKEDLRTFVRLQFEVVP